MINKTEIITQYEIDLLADIAWWVKGYLAADKDNCPFSEEHTRAFEKGMILLKKINKEKEEN